MIKAPKNLGIEGPCLDIIKNTYDKPITNIIMNGEKPKIISSKTRNETSMSTQHRA
jgi:hypothetical protein